MTTARQTRCGACPCAHQRRAQYQTARRHRCIWSPIERFTTAGQVSGYTGARASVDSLPEARTLSADRGHDAEWFRNDLIDRDIYPCILSRKNRKEPIPHDEGLYEDRHEIEIMSGRIKDWRRVATRYDRSPAVLFWL